MSSSLLLPPDILRQLELLKMRARRSFLGSRQGGHLSQKKGHGIEFSDYRKYELGDDPRHIDWGVYGRSDRLYVKRFQEEQDLSIGILLDSSQSMHHPAGSGKWEMARSLAGAIVYCGLMQQDRVMVTVPGLYEPPFMSGSSAYHTIAKALTTLPRAAQIDFERLARLAVSRMRYPGIAVFISDFLMPFETIQSILQHMQSLNLEVTALQVLSPHDLAPASGHEEVIAIDSETGAELTLSLNDESRKEYAFLLEEHQLSIKHYCAERAIPFATIQSDQDFISVLINEVTSTGLLQ
jgi:uncharacterized protein (DUF58 family)